jgi:hypothetical protein
MGNQPKGFYDNYYNQQSYGPGSMQGGSGGGNFHYPLPNYFEFNYISYFPGGRGDTDYRGSGFNF